MENGMLHSTLPLSILPTPFPGGVLSSRPPGELRRRWAGDRAGIPTSLIDSEDEARSPNPAARETSAEPFAESFSNCFPLHRGKAATKEDADPEHNSYVPSAQGGPF